METRRRRLLRMDACGLSDRYEYDKSYEATTYQLPWTFFQESIVTSQLRSGNVNVEVD